MNGDHLCPGIAVRSGGSLVCGTVGAIHHHADAVQRGGYSATQVGEVTVQRVFGFIDDPPDRRASWPLQWQFLHERFDLILDHIVQLVAALCEEFDAVIRHGVVGGGDHHAHVCAEGIGEIGHGWGGEDAYVVDVHAL